MKGGHADRQPRPVAFRLRLGVLLGLLLLAAGGLLARAVQLQLVNHNFLVDQGNARCSRVVLVTSHRGAITDRNGEPLAISTPVDSVSIDPRKFAGNPAQLTLLARAAGVDPQELARRVFSNQDRDFLYVARGLQPSDARKVRDLDLDGLTLTRGYRRYYPAAEVTGHTIGFTDVDDLGQDGVELAFDHWLSGEDGAKRVIQDSQGRKVEDVESIRTVRPGRDLTLSIDLRLQYLAYRELKAAVQANNARSGSIVVIDVQTGEVLAMVNQPTFNPNDRGQLTAGDYRNRAETDYFEPGSSIKPFFIAAAFASGRFQASSIIDTNPGFIQVGSVTFPDEHNLGAIPIATVLAKSSNVGMARIALALEPKQIWTTLSSLGFGQVTASGFPGESAGVLSDFKNWHEIGIATMSHGYALSVTPLQLAQAYATLGAYGVRRPVSLTRVDAPVAGERVLDESVCRPLLYLLESVVIEGTGEQAQVPGYRVAGKTGTAYKSEPGGYSTDRYVAVFGGVAPVTHPRLAAVVVIDEPNAGLHHGADVAAPVFAAVMGGALRLMAVPPDNVVPNHSPLLDSPKLARR